MKLASYRRLLYKDLIPLRHWENVKFTLLLVLFKGYYVVLFYFRAQRQEARTIFLINLLHKQKSYISSSIKLDLPDHFKNRTQTPWGEVGTPWMGGGGVGTP